MANDIMGMFSNPADIRAARIDDLMRQQQQISQMGGSMNQLLGQVAAGGGATGALLAEGMGGMFGWQTPEEKRASQIQDMASQVSMEDPVALGAFAKRLNDMGMTKEAIQVMEKRQAVINQLNTDEDRKLRLEQDKKKGAVKPTRTYRTQVGTRMKQIGSGKDMQVVAEPVFEEVTEEGTFNPDTGTYTWKRLGTSGTSTSGNPREEWLKMMAGNLTGGDSTEAPQSTTVGEIKLSVAQEQAFRQKWKESGSKLPFEEWVKTTMPDRTNIAGGAVLSPEEQAAYNQYLEKMFIATQRPMSKEDWVKQYRSK